MKCPHCQVETPDSATRCQACGGQIICPSTPPSPPQPIAPPPVVPGQPTPEPAWSGAVKTSGMAIAALVFGILAIVSCGTLSLGPILPLVFGLTAMSQIKNSQGRVGGHGLALTGVITGLASLLLGILIIPAMLFPVFAKSREKARQTSCINNQRQLAMSITMYTQDHEGHYPASFADIESYAGSAKLFVCPSAQEQTIGYGYNSFLAGKKEEQISDYTSLVITADGGDAHHLITGDMDLVTDRHQGGFVAAFADGHTKFIEEGEIIQLEQPVPEGLAPVYEEEGD